MSNQPDLFPPLTPEEKRRHADRIMQIIATRPDAETLKQRSERIRVQQQKRNADRPDRKRGAKSRQSAQYPFAGVDGEGGGTDEHGRQQYLLLRAGESELFNNNQRLATEDCLEFLLSLPKNYIYVGFYFTYDVTMILLDVPYEYLRKICSPRTLFDNNPDHQLRRKSNYVYWRDYAIDFVPRQHFSVARVNRGTNKIIPGSARTVNETAGFFQAPFIKVCEDWKAEIGLSDRDYAAIISGKARRESFNQLDKAERDYCRLECETLAAIMERFRTVCVEADLVPTKWRGAGWLASHLHTKHKTPRHIDQWGDRPVLLQQYAQQAYYGGRFEISRIGYVAEKIYEYDINSAYPAAMLELPCPIHTRWHKFGKTSIEEMERMGGRLFCAHISFKGIRDASFYHLPIRTKKGVIIWPMEGEGVYWSPELRLASQDMNIEIMGGYYAEQRCDCDVFHWVRDLYRVRKSLGKSTRGYPLKLGINALYGKLAQRAGSRAFHDYIAAGLITSITRARLMTAYMQIPQSVVMLATDGVYSTVPLQLSIGEELGQWECKEHAGGIFIVQPGVYWFLGEDTDKNISAKTRGMPKARLAENRDKFAAVWKDWLRFDGIGPYPSVGVEIPFFCPTRLALHRKDPYAAGKWDRMIKEIRFDWTNKRAPEIVEIRDGSVLTRPYLASFKSVYYDPDVKTSSDEYREMLDLHFEGSPDFTSLAEDLGHVTD